MVNKLVVATLAGATMLASGLAYAADATGAVRTWNEQNRQLTLDNGQTYVLNANVATTGVTLTPGSRVTITYDVNAGQNMVTRIAVAPATGGAAGGAAGAGGNITPGVGGGPAPAAGGAAGGAGGAAMPPAGGAAGGR